MVYMVAFFSSMIFGYWATRINPKTNRGLVFLCSAISVLIPSILAGLRDVSIGTDITAYVISEFNIALNIDSFSQYTKWIWEKETGYMLLVFTVAKIFGNIQWLLFFIEFIIMVCVYIGAWKFREKVSLPFLLMIYFLFFYNLSYNMIRQAISMAIIFMATSWLFEKRYVKYFVAIAIAMLFHTTAFVGVISFFIFWFLNSSHLIDNARAKNLRGYLIMIVIAIGCISLPYITQFLVNSGILSSRYLLYFEGDIVTSYTFENIIYLIEIVLVLAFSRNLETQIENFAYYKVNLACTFFTLQLSNTMLYGNRLSLYFAIINILLLAKMPWMMQNRYNRGIFISVTFAMFFVYWLYVYIINGASDTYPYITFWQER